jgi:cytochrome c peroxidase
MPKTELGFLPDPASQPGAFKTPTLRNVALTAPYMHDGRFTTLKQVLDFYGRGTQANRGHLDQSTPAVRLDARASASVRRS